LRLPMNRRTAAVNAGVTINWFVSRHAANRVGAHLAEGAATGPAAADSMITTPSIALSQNAHTAPNPAHVRLE
jgi:hypothetical protein